MAEQEIITTKIFRSSKEFIAKRTKRIEEAIAFENGTFDNSKKIVRIQ